MYDNDCFSCTKYVGADTETNGLDTQKCKAFCMAFVNEEGQKIFIDFRKLEVGHIQFINELIDRSILVFHNAKFDIKMLENAGFKVKNFEDSIIMAYLVNEYHGSFKLDYLAEKYLKETKYTNEVFEHWKKINKASIEKNGFYDVPQDILEPYTIKDAELALKLFYLFKTPIEAFNLQNQYSLEKDFIKSVISIERNGMKIDVPYGVERGDFFQKEIEEYKTFFKYKHGIENPNSPEQIKTAFRELGISLSSTKKEILLDLAANNAGFAKELIYYRQISKLLSGFLIPILSNTDRETRRIHTNFNTIFTKTGRLSSSNPINFQNLPRASEDESDIRNTIRHLIIPEDNYYLIGGDYDQEEMRIIADECKCEALINLFLSNTRDVYTEIAKLIWQHTEIDKQLRYTAKQTTLGMSYGMGPTKFVLQARKYGFNFDIAEATEVIKIMKDRFPEISDTLQHYSWQIRQKGYVTDRFGKRYNVPIDFSYKALNAIIQGTAAQVMKYGILELEKYCNNKFRIINSIHDEILCEVHNDIPKEEAWKIIQTSMEKISEKFRVPIKMSEKLYEGNWSKIKKDSHNNS
jgi:DNA polymerase-1